MQWFLKEQVEEVALMTTLLRVADRAGHNLFDLEDSSHAKSARHQRIPAHRQRPAAAATRP